MKSIAVFRSAAFDQSWPAEGNPNDVPLGRDLAEYLKTKLAEQNIPVQNPIQGEGGWIVDGQFQNIPFALFVHWAPVGTPPVDSWVIQPQVRRGIIQSLFGARKPPEELQPLLTQLNTTLSHDPRINDLVWMDDNQFA